MNGIPAIVAASLLFSSGGLFIKLAPMPGLAVACGRAIITSAFFLIVLRPRLRQARLSTALAYAGMIVTFVVATKLTTAANAVFLQYTAPVYVLFLSHWLLGEKVKLRDIVFLAAAFVGMALVFSDTAEGGQRAGNLIALLSGVIFAFTIVFLRRDAQSSPAVATASTALGNILAVLGTLPFAFGDLATSLTPAAVGMLLYLGTLQVGLAYVLLNRGLRTVPATTASLVSMIEPVANPIWVFIGAGERPSTMALMGGAVVLAAVTARSLLRS